MYSETINFLNDRPHDTEQCMVKKMFFWGNRQFVTFWEEKVVYHISNIIEQPFDVPNTK